MTADEERARLAGEAAASRRYRVRIKDYGYIPRRVLWEHLTPLEQQIKGAMFDVEKLGAHRLLTDAVVCLEHANRALADWIDLGKPGAAYAEDKRAPVPMILHCPECSARHIDEGEFATKPHHTHACQSCGMVWRPAIGPTCGVQFLPGFENDAAIAEAEVSPNA